MPPMASARGVGSSPAGVCACCVVWEVTRGPHAGERAAFASRNSLCGPLGIGRKATSWLRLRKDLEVSGLHAELCVALVDGERPGLKLTLRDADSTNGTRVNGVALAPGETTEVQDQDLLQFGRSTVRVRLGDTQCPRARRLGDASEKSEAEDVVAPTASEPEREPVLLAVVPPQEARNDPVPEPASLDHSDENAFETPLPKPTELLAVCMVCGQALAAWSVLEQQLHVNACLDRKAGGATTTTATQPSATAATTTTGHGKKRKRQATLVKADEELAVALALSESLVDPEQQVDMEMALVRGELSQVDAQLKKLEKKRVALVKKLEKLEKTKRKVHKSQVRAPEEARVLMDLEWALRVVFPASREVCGIIAEGGRARTLRPAVARLIDRYKAIDEKEMETPYVTMWQRCAQLHGRSVECQAKEDDNQQEEEDDALYVNRLLRWLRARETKQAASSGTAEQHTSDSVVVVEEPAVLQEDVDMASEEAVTTTGSESSNFDLTDNATTTDRVVPDVVKRVFPGWRENLAFLETQSVPDLKDALAEMRKMQTDRMLESIATETSDGTNDREEETAACAWFEGEMLRLIAAKQSSLSDEVEVVVLVDSQDDEDVGSDARSIEREEPTGSPRSVLSIDDSSDEEGEIAPDESLDQRTTSPTANSEENNEMEDVSPQDGNFRDVGARDAFAHVDPTPVPATSAPTSQRSQEVPIPQHGQPSTGQESSEARLEGQLLTALKANAKLYESVLLLQPLDLQQFLDYVRNDAGLKCPKTVLVRFCDRHGITFKNS